MSELSPIGPNEIRKFGPWTVGIGVLLVLIGMVGVGMPWVLSIVTSVYVAWVFLIGGFVWAYHTFKSHPGSFLDWLKPLLLIVTGGLMLFNPMAGVAAIGLVLSFYLLLDAFGSFALAKALHPLSGWGWMAFSGLISLFLAILFLIGWPTTSMMLVGIYVGISLIFDGSALIAIGWAMRKVTKEIG